MRSRTSFSLPEGKMHAL
ncbi:hypothetical protein Gotri_014630 [Gossypium trilobum]|uniref:Uncharacterized protein n=4 Tax=Gossypium TaxID=3633 RepID=A0A7J8P9X8_GOSRA|nr:hypothetical protein [Gossypium lobatum]MBA0585840.1 hypothetical protein [Gossypium raimondii]MBA0765428.1 hypothetical protein [Gossypium trilobum]MBA0798256.1 hypothetical protein [Gossypium harknessii]